jgi:predicted Ser/Thr protein kinase
MPSDPSVSTDLSWQRIDACLRELLELEAPEQARHLESLHQSEPELAQRLQRLLGVSGRIAGLDSNEVLAGVAQAGFAELTGSREGQRFGEWELQQRIGSGGMADVYLAVRPIENGVQQAAIKLVHVPGAGWSTESLAREAQVLARLSDPRIARLLDFGRTAAGEPWIAMEFVDGVPIDRWCAQHALPVRQRARLMINVALAIDHAHRSLVVHRDIKPGNVLVAVQDGSVKVLDFGIARSLPAPGASQATRTALSAYTQAYASPEQLAGESVTVASDVYQLGELLYLLLAGEHAFANTPANPARQLQAREAGAMPPSRRAAARGEQALARAGGTDLDTIALKAMEFRPERRYLTAREFADDLGRWLDGKAISARRGRLYRAGRALRRHWAAAAIAALALGLSANYVFNLRDREILLEAQRQRTERILDVAVEVMDETDPFVAGASPEASDAAMRRIRTRLHEDAEADPVFRTRILNLLASVHGRRGQVPVAIELRQEALALAEQHGLSDALVADTAYALARAYNSASRNDEALALLRRHDALITRHVPIQSQALWARIESQTGDPAAARRRLEAVAAGLETRSALSYDERALFNQLAIVRGAQGDNEASIAAAARAFEGFEPGTGKEIASWVSYGMNLAVAYGDARRYREADDLHQRVSAWVEQHLGREHPQFAVVERSRATGLIRVARFVQAYDVLEAAVPSAARQQTPMHRVSFLQTRAMAGLYSGRAHAAVEYLFTASELADRELRSLVDMRARVEEELAWALFEIGAYREAADVMRQIPAAAANALRADMLRVLLAQLDIAPLDAAALQTARDKVAARPCLASELAALEAALVAPSTRRDMTMPAQCDGQGGSLAAALGVRWTPDWIADFPLTPFASELASRWQRGDLSARALPPSLEPAWQRWQQAAQSGPETTLPSQP